MTRQVVAEAFGNPDETRETGNREYLIYRKRSIFIGFREGMVDSYGDLKNVPVGTVPDPIARQDMGTADRYAEKVCVHA